MILPSLSLLTDHTMFWKKASNFLWKFCLEFGNKVENSDCNLKTSICGEQKKFSKGGTICLLTLCLVTAASRAKGTVLESTEVQFKCLNICNSSIWDTQIHLLITFYWSAVNPASFLTCSQLNWIHQEVFGGTRQLWLGNWVMCDAKWTSDVCPYT